MYGAQTPLVETPEETAFENDVEMYGAQTSRFCHFSQGWFENDVEMYGAQTLYAFCQHLH